MVAGPHSVGGTAAKREPPPDTSGATRKQPRTTRSVLQLVAALPKAVSGLGKENITVRLPEPWREVAPGCIVARFNEPTDAPFEPSCIAGFDFDNTLSPRGGRGVAPGAIEISMGDKDPAKWYHFFPHAPAVLRELVASGHALVVATNESTDHLKKKTPIEGAIQMKCGRVARWAADVGVPVLAFVALSKRARHAPSGAYFHKKQEADTDNSGMWQAAAAFLDLSPRADGSFFCGDAAGRERDHGDDDMLLARNARVRFYDEKAFFLERHPAARYSP